MLRDTLKIESTCLGWQTRYRKSFAVFARDRNELEFAVLEFFAFSIGLIQITGHGNLHVIRRRGHANGTQGLWEFSNVAGGYGCRSAHRHLAAGPTRA